MRFLIFFYIYMLMLIKLKQILAELNNKNIIISDSGYLRSLFYDFFETKKKKANLFEK